MLGVTVRQPDDAEKCPFRDVIDRIGDKWSLLVLYVLRQGPTRFNEIKRQIGDITQRMLTRTLRHLERDGYIVRTVESDRPVRVSYSLSDIGQSAFDAAQIFVEWAESRHEDIRESRKRYDEKFP